MDNINQNNLSASKAELAHPEELEAVMKLYRSLAGTPYCAWDDEYPSEDETAQDLQENRVLCLRDNRGTIAAVISIEEGDEAFWALPAFADGGNFACLARLGVQMDLQGHGYAKRLFLAAVKESERRGFDGVRFIVHRAHRPAIALYESLGCRRLGEAELYGMDWYCYEKRIKK